MVRFSALHAAVFLLALHSGDIRPQGAWGLRAPPFFPAFFFRRNRRNSLQILFSWGSFRLSLAGT